MHLPFEVQGGEPQVPREFGKSVMGPLKPMDLGRIRHSSGHASPQHSRLRPLGFRVSVLDRRRWTANGTSHLVSAPLVDIIGAERGPSVESPKFPTRVILSATCAQARSAYRSDTDTDMSVVASPPSIAATAATARTTNAPADALTPAPTPQRRLSGARAAICGTRELRARASRQELAAAVGESGRVDGVDPSAAMCDMAAHRLRGLGNVSVHVAPAQELPYADGVFDAVVFSQVLLYIPDVPQALAEAGKMMFRSPAQMSANSLTLMRR